MPRPKGGADLLEDRRHRALALVDSGCSLNEAARRVGCGASSVMRWYHARRRGGKDALRVRFSPGRPHRLNAKQERRLLRLLLQGPMARGYRTNLWTQAGIAQLIAEAFGVHYHPHHIGRLMLASTGVIRNRNGAPSSRTSQRSSGGNGKSGRALKKSRSAGRPHSFLR